jgi:hypothetical protein
VNGKLIKPYELATYSRAYFYPPILRIITHVTENPDVLWINKRLMKTFIPHHILYTHACGTFYGWLNTSGRGSIPEGWQKSREWILSKLSNEMKVILMIRIILLLINNFLKLFPPLLIDKGTFKISAENKKTTKQISVRLPKSHTAKKHVT